jgi:hypothetical protein
MSDDDKPKLGGTAKDRGTEVIRTVLRKAGRREFSGTVRYRVESVPDNDQVVQVWPTS